MRELTLLCPLDAEAVWLARALPRRPRATVVGPGEAVRQWIAEHARPGLLPVLCGLAGALHDDPKVGSAALVRRVAAPRAAGLSSETRHVRETSTRESGWLIPGASASFPPCVTALTVAATVTDPRERADLARRHPEAGVIDCESWWFACACEAAGVPWLIVRGVSDGPGERLPATIDTWVDTRGRNRLLKVVSSLLRTPSDLPSLPRLARRGRTAMTSVARALDSMWPALTATEPTTRDAAEARMPMVPRR